MAFQASPQTTADAFQGFRRNALALKNLLSDFNTQSLAGALSANFVKSIYQQLIIFKAGAEAAAAITGIGQYAQDQYQDENYDVVSEGQALVALVETAIATIVAGIPTANAGGTDYVLVEEWASNGINVRSFSTGNAASLRDAFQAIIDAIT